MHIWYLRNLKRLLSKAVAGFFLVFVVFAHSARLENIIYLVYRLPLTHSFPTDPFSNPPANSNRNIFWCFQWVGKGCIGNEWVNTKLNQKSSNVSFLTLMDYEKTMNYEKLKITIMLYNNPQVFLKISQNSHESTCTRVSHLKPQLAALLKNRL